MTVLFSTKRHDRAEKTFDALPIPEFPPMNLPKWKASDISYTASKMKTHVARGADHWSVTEILQLPECILELYAWFFDAIERRVLTWPIALTVGLITLIPKLTMQMQPQHR